MDRCKCFLEQWMEALCNKDFVALLQNKAKYDEYLKGFRLLQFGTWRTIQAEGSDDSIPDGLTKALVGRIQGKQKTLQEFWETQKWFEEMIPSLQTYELTVNQDAEPLSKSWIMNIRIQITSQAEHRLQNSTTSMRLIWKRPA